MPEQTDLQTAAGLDLGTLALLTQLDRIEKAIEASNRAGWSLQPDEAPLLSWLANRWADYAHSRLFRGIAVFNNDATNAIYVGLAPGSGTAAGSLITLDARGYCVLPVTAGSISIGGPGTGTALFIPLDYTPAISAGKF